MLRNEDVSISICNNCVKLNPTPNGLTKMDKCMKNIFLKQDALTK